MKRIELIYSKLIEIYKDNEGLSAIQVADALNLSRANVSNDLNRLVTENKAMKIKGKPTLFIPIVFRGRRKAKINDR